MTARRQRIFSVPPGAPFLDTLADALASGRLVGDIGWGRDPLAVADVAVYLPTRRAARAFAGALSARATGPAILPRIVPLGDADEAEFRLIGDSDGSDAEFAELAPPAQAAERLVFLADLVMRWRKQLSVAITPLAPGEFPLIADSAKEAFALASDLMRVLDTLTIEGVGADALTQATPGEHDVYWQAAQSFLSIATEAWPAWLSAQQLADPVKRRSDVLRARARQIAEGRAAGPFIAAGSTGTNPATAELIAAIARHSRGAVVLPGLDLDCDDVSFAAIIDPEAPAHGHPQAALARLLQRLNASRADVSVLGASPPALIARARFLTASMQPAAATADWAQARRRPEEAQNIEEGLREVAIIEAENEREEALAIALLMREAIREPERSAALVTPDRALAERVGAMLRRWKIEIDDSAGRSLSRTPRGAYAILVAQWLASPADGSLIAALLSHPHTSLGLTRSALDRAAACIDIGLLRGHPPARSISALMELLPARRQAAADRYAPRPAKRLSAADWGAAQQAITKLEALRKSFEASVSSIAASPIASWIAAHRLVLDRLAGGDAGADSWLSDEPDGEALRQLFETLIAGGDQRAPCSLFDYPQVVKQLMDDAVLGPPTRTHPRLAIWGLLEARLLHADRIILGGLNEAVWPPQPSSDAFLNRAMRSQFNLPQPERRIGQTAHDFVSAFAGARDAILTRSRTSGGSPTVASRFWQRLVAYVGPEDVSLARANERGAHWLAIARALDYPGAAAPAERPSPKPPSELIPRRLSVSRIETLVRDPYAIFAREILGIDPLQPIGVAADAALRGTLIHDAIARFSQCIDPMTPQALADLIALGEKLFGESGVERQQIMFWRPAFRRAAASFIEWERERRPHIHEFKVEQGGKLSLALIDGSTFELTARADRIELLNDGSLAIVDFKTGTLPSRRQVQSGYSPQLTLEAAMATGGGFGDAFYKKYVSTLEYVRLSGARSGEVVCEVTRAARRNGEFVDPATVPAAHVAQLVKRINAHIAQAIGFPSHAHRDPKQRRPGDFDHLARVAEWSRGAGGDEDE
ncbi:MAG: double-strand break repair protein AddB [Beijerinckiaceae bacterium]